MGRMTFAEFEQLPDEEIGLELMDGELIRMPPARVRYKKAEKRIFELLDQIVARQQGIGETHIRAGYRMGTDPGTWFLADVSVTHADQAGDEDYYDGAPPIAIEVAADTKSPELLEAKVETYLAHGGREVWILYPKTRHVWIRRAGCSISELQTDAIRSDLLSGIEIPLDKIF